MKSVELEIEQAPKSLALPSTNRANSLGSVDAVYLVGTIMIKS